MVTAKCDIAERLLFSCKHQSRCEGNLDVLRQKGWSCYCHLSRQKVDQARYRIWQMEKPPWGLGLYYWTWHWKVRCNITLWHIRVVCYTWDLSAETRFLAATYSRRKRIGRHV